MSVNLLPTKATAIWLVDNTSLTFKQIASFCNLHELEIEAIANNEAEYQGIRPFNPIVKGLLSQAELDACQNDPSRNLKQSTSNVPQPSLRNKGPRYVPLARRGDKPSAIAWLLNHYPDMPDNMIIKIVGTTRGTIDKIRSRSHWNIQNIKPRDPVELGICTTDELNVFVAKVAKITAERQQHEALANAEPEASSDPV